MLIFIMDMKIANYLYIIKQHRLTPSRIASAMLIFIMDMKIANYLYIIKQHRLTPTG